MNTVVVFRTLTRNPQKGQVIALFPFDDEGRGLCGSYMHVGQHGAADYAGMLTVSRPATPDEYSPLQQELESAPYRYEFSVRKRAARRWY